MMADFMQFHQNTNDPSIFSRSFINENTNPDVVNLKKRKLLTASESGLPEPKHKCREAVVDSEHDLSSVTSMVTDGVHTGPHTQAESTQDSNSVHGDSQSANVDLKVGECSANTDSNDEASTPWNESGLCRSSNHSNYTESSIVRDRKDGREAQFLGEHTNWHDIDGLDYCQDSIEPESEGFHELLSSGGVDPNIFTLPSEVWDGEQEIQDGRRKPTIDQEFEQYFSTLML